MNIDEILKQAEAATPGPWEVFYEDALWMASTLSIPQHPVAITGLNKANAAFIAASRTNVPALCAEVLTLRCELAECLAIGERIIEQGHERQRIGKIFTDKLQQDNVDLRARVAELEKALEPFAERANNVAVHNGEEASEWVVAARISDLRAARRALEQAKEGQ